MKTLTGITFVVMMGAWSAAASPRQGGCEPSFFRESDEVISDDSIGERGKGTAR